MNPSDSASPNRSFQSEPLPKKRQSVDRLVLADVSNEQPAKRQCSSRARVSITQHLQAKASRGDPSKGGQVRYTNVMDTVNISEDSINLRSEDSINLRSMKQTQPRVFKEGGERLEQYIEKNTTAEVQKAFALVIFGKCVTTFKMGIIEATEAASKFSGFSGEVIRRWAMNVFAEFFGSVSCVEDVDDEDLIKVLSSKRGCHSKVVSLINDEQFCIKAAKYVRQNGYKKGEPNLTLRQFCTWVEEEQNIMVCEQTASTWLRKLGFSYRQYSKGVYFDGHNREDVVEARISYCIR